MDRLDKTNQDNGGNKMDLESHELHALEVLESMHIDDLTDAVAHLHARLAERNKLANQRLRDVVLRLDPEVFR